MKLLKCDNGHFYDGDKFASCPHCQAGNGPAAVPGGFGAGDDVTIPINMGGAPAAPQNMGWGTAPVDVTVPVSNYGGYGDLGDTVPVTEPYGGATVTVAEDDEKTQGFFDDIIPNPVPTNKAAAAANDNVIAVGWLICVKGVNAGRDYRLRLGRNAIGRDESNGVALLGDTSVSRTEQAVLVYEPHANKFYALPGRSTSLAYLNGDVLLSRTEMKKNDILELGKTQLMLIPCCDEKFSWTSVFDK